MAFVGRECVRRIHSSSCERPALMSSSRASQRSPNDAELGMPTCGPTSRTYLRSDQHVTCENMPDY